MIVKGPPSARYPWEPITIAEQLERTASKYPDNLALVDGDRRHTWSDIRRSARLYGRALMAGGIERGDHVAQWLPNQAEWVIGWLGAAYAGAVVVPLNTRYKAEEVAYILRQSDARMLLMRDRFLQIDFLEMLERLMPEGVAKAGETGFPDLRQVAILGQAAAGAISYEELLALGEGVSEESLDQRAAEVSYDDPTIIVYTSGTTGHPKGAVHSHRVLRNECSIAEWMDVGPGDLQLGHMPFFHVAGAFSGILPPLIAGGGLVLMDHWNPTTALELVQRWKVSSFSGIPTHFIDLINHPALEEFDVSSLRSGWIGGAANPPEVIDGVIQKLGMTRLLPVYGMTETTSVTTFPRPEDSREVILSGRGVPVSDFQLRITDPDSGRELEADEEGEICVRGHCVMQGYYRNEEATSAVFDDDGWFHTGDLGELDADGYLAVTGRRSDMFIVGGSNAYPAEIELALCEHPQVVQAYVVGVPHDRLGEVGYAFIEPRPASSLDEDEIREFCRQRLADYKVPRFVEFTDDWPLTATGKIQRFVLREKATKLAQKTSSK